MALATSFSTRFPYSELSVRLNAPDSPGVYRITYAGAGANHYVAYVGQSLNLKERLLDHLRQGEPNSCLRQRVRTSVCGFRFAVVRNLDDRVRLEADQIAEFSPECNRC